MPDLNVQGLTINADTLDRLDFMGDVENRGSDYQRWVRVTVRLLAEDDQVLAEQSDMVGLEWITPGARAPFRIAIEHPPIGWRRYLLEVAGRAHDFHDASVPQPHLTLDVGNAHYREIDRGGLLCSVIALLSNPGPTPASHVKAAGTLYGPKGNVVGVLSPYVVPRGILGVGERMFFELKYYALAGMVVNFMVQVQGRMAASDEPLAL
ncbi:MAG: hypothetical protein V1772_08020 [Chloroflexota bacterium]